MKPTLSILALTAAVLLTGCETYVADRRPVHRSGYYGGHRHHYDDDHRHHGHSDYRRSHYDNRRNYDRRDVVVVNPPRVSGRTGVSVSSSRGPSPYHRRSW